MCNLNELSAIDLLLSSEHFCSSGVCQASQFVPFLPWGATMHPEKSRKLDLVLKRLYCLRAPKARVGSPLFSSGQHKPIWLYYMMCLVLSANPFIKTLTTPARFSSHVFGLACASTRAGAVMVLVSHDLGSPHDSLKNQTQGKYKINP